MRPHPRSRVSRAATALGLAAALALPLIQPVTAAAEQSPAVVPAAVAAPEIAAPALELAADAPINFHTDGNPILGDGSFYSADAAPLVDGNNLYIYTGHDEATAQQGGFNMKDYAVFSTADVASGNWSITKNAMDPDVTFSWANGNNAFAGQVVKGDDGKFYWYAPVQTRNTTVPNAMAIGVAVSDTPTGPWTDANGAPLVTWTDVFGTSTNGQEVIDPHVFRDTDGKNYLYWGSWSVSRMIELTADLAHTTGTIKTMSGLTGFYEAPWVFKKNNLYYMVYDWKQGGSACTPSNYQACIAYATATNPAGPWSYKGIILGGTSATTVHPSLIEFKNQWYITYHTKDAVGGGHFRRSVAIDKVEWNGDTILPVTQTWAKDPKFVLNKNVAPDAQVSASFTETPPMRVGALNDGRALTALLPPDQWGNYRGTTSSNESDWVSYQWQAPVRINSAGIQFHQDSNWIRPPASWVMEYLDVAGVWKPVVNATYPTAVNTWNTVTFDAVTTTALRATFKGRASGAYFNSVSVSEWEVYAVDPTGYNPVAVGTKPAVAPVLPEAVRLNYASGPSVWAPVNWKPFPANDYATPGTFTVQGRAVGYSAAMVTATVTVSPTAETPVVPDTLAPNVSLSVSGTQGKDGWYSSAVVARISADDDTVYRAEISTRTGTGAWTVTPNVRHVDVPVSAQGSVTISGKATDAAGNTSAEVSRTVKIDTTVPTSSAVVDPVTRATTITAADALSGLDVVEYRFDGVGNWITYTPGTAVAAPDGLPHQLVYRAVDVAGNQVTKTAQIPLDPNATLTGNIAKYATPTASFTSSWESVNGLVDGTNAPQENAAAKLGAQWGTWPQVGEQRAQLTWAFQISTDQISVWWAQDSDDSANAGLIAPRTWVLQYLDADGTTWKPVTLVEGSSYGRARNLFNTVTFAPISTRSLRIVAQSWGTVEGGGSAGIREFQVIAAAAAPADTTAPTVSAAFDAAGRAVTVTAADENGGSGVASVEYRIGAGAWTAYTAAFAVGDAAVTVEYRATDVAGNVSAVKSLEVPKKPIDAPVFTDVPADNQFADDIRWMAESGLSTGTVTGNGVLFQPGLAVSRQAFAAFLYRLDHSGTGAPACTSAPYADVPVSSAFCGEISWLKSKNITTGFTGNTFRPGASIERQAMAAFLYRHANPGVQAPACTSRPFTDVLVGAPFCGEISWLKGQEITTGFPGGTFQPGGIVQRQAVAAFLHRYSEG
ncbi:glycoside hydrolase family 43 [Nakamurella silvestris]|nr:glycoside hydrolase family 43 [Nakamurella silvestris]